MDFTDFVEIEHQAADALLQLRGTGEDEVPIEDNITRLCITRPTTPKTKRRGIFKCKIMR